MVIAAPDPKPSHTTWPDVANNLLKFLAAGAILAALFALVLIGKVDSSVFVTLAVAALTGLGVHGATKYGS